MKFLYSSPQTTTKVSSINTGRSIVYTLCTVQVEGIQRKCKKALELWGYREVSHADKSTNIWKQLFSAQVWQDEEKLRTFQPVINLGNFHI